MKFATSQVRKYKILNFQIFKFFPSIHIVSVYFSTQPNSKVQANCKQENRHFSENKRNFIYFVERQAVHELKVNKRTHTVSVYFAIIFAQNIVLLLPNLQGYQSRLFRYLSPQFE